MIYQWKPEARVRVDAQIAGAEMERLRVLHNGRLERNLVLEAARNPLNPLHPEFEWDDRKAAEAHRMDRAGYLIRSIEVVVTEPVEAKPVRAFVSVTRDDDRSYTSVSHALADPALRQQVLMAALRELEAWRERYAELVELAQVFAAIEEARLAE